MGEATRLPRLAVATLPGLDHFLPDLLRGLAGSGRVEVRSFAVRTPGEMAAALAWADDPARDAIWLEFCWPPFPALLATTRFEGRRVLVRVHRIEAYEAEHVARTDWSQVTDLIVVSQDMARVVREVRPGIERTLRLEVVHNGIDLGRVAARAEFDRFRIGWCGAFIPRKNPALALQILHRLRREDPRYRLHVASQSGDRLTTESFCHQAALLDMADAIRLEGRIDAAAMPAWHAANGILLSTSLHESFGMAVAEAAAAGCDLAVLDHVGAAEFWPEATRFVAIDRALALIRGAAPDRWRTLVAERFGLDRQVARVLDLLARRPFASAAYWEARYQAGGTSGAGSTGRLAAFKAAVLNQLVAEHRITRVLELGCGDGQQLALARYPSYVGVDVADASLALCRRRFAADPGKRFQPAEEPLPPSELALSLDVVFHLVEDEVFHEYMARLFGAAQRLVAIYASDRDEPTRDAHVRHRDVSAWVARHAPGWRRAGLVRNPYPWDPARPEDTSFADFHIFARAEDAHERELQRAESA